MRMQGYLAFVAGVCLTAWTCIAVLQAQQTSIRSTFLRDTDKIASDTNTRLQIYFDMLLSIKGAFVIHDRMTRAQFAGFVRELHLAQRYPGFQAIQFVRYVPDQDLQRFTDAVQRDTSLDPAGYPAFAVHPQFAAKDHYIIEYIEPLKGNESAFGLDIAALPPHRVALEQGRDSGLIIATERTVLVQDATRQPGFVARAPVYRTGMPVDSVDARRAALVGWVAIVFKVGNLMQEVIDPALRGQVSLRIHDAGELAAGAAAPATGANLMFDMRRASARAVPGLTVHRPLDVAQRRWVLRFEGHDAGRYRRDYGTVAMIAIGGVLTSGLIAALLIATRRSRDLTAQVRATLEGLEHSLAELARQKASAESAHSDLSAVLVTLRQAQTNLITSAKMASLGSLVAGIAHELNTPIGNCLLTATSLDDMVADFERHYQQGGVKRTALETHLADTKLACSILTKSLRRAADLITSFKQVAVDQTSDQRRRFDLNAVIGDTLATFNAQLRRANCDVSVECVDPLTIDSYPGGVGHVLSNLIHNALLHAFAGRSSGHILISARVATGEQSQQEISIMFSDDGAGMPPDVLERVFDPFFTTKMGQGGSGLGMNIVYNIVTGMLGGRIDIDSAMGQGTRITIRIPRSAPERATVRPGLNLSLM